jgi:hypothetical protein
MHQVLYRVFEVVDAVAHVVHWRVSSEFPPCSVVSLCGGWGGAVVVMVMMRQEGGA